MEPPSPCPDVQRLRALLAGHLPQAEEAELTAHLDACPRCRERLEESAGGTGWLPGSKDWAPEAQPPVAEELRRAMRRVLSSTAEAVPSSDGPTEAEVRSFLGPPVRGGYMGQFGSYDVAEVIGRGGMGIVLKAHEPMLNRTVAIKVLAPRAAADPVARLRFLGEAQSAAAIKHDNLVTIFAVDEADGVPYLAMEYIAGSTLKRRIDAEGAMEVEEIVRLGRQIALGLAAAHHQGLVHRDIKPANILLEGPSQRVKIADFGLAKAVAEVSITQSGVLAGTPQYMSPEQASGELTDHRTDLFSFGSVLYAMCTGRAPFEGGTVVAVARQLCEDAPTPVRELNPKIPDWLAGIVEKLLAKNPAHRFQSAAEVAELLGQAEAGVQPPSVPGRRPEPTGAAAGRDRRARRRWLVVAVAVGLLVAILALAELTGLTNLRRFLPGW